MMLAIGPVAIVPPELMTMDTWRPVSGAYGACSNTESASRREGAVSAIGSDSPAGTVIGKHRWISVIHSWLRVRSEARWRRGGPPWAWQYLDSGIDGDLALLLAVRSQHDGIDWDRFADPAARGQHDGIDWDCARDQGERVP
jgi:hypothetical protein